MTVKLLLLIKLKVIILICQFIYILPSEGMKKLTKPKEEGKKGPEKHLSHAWAVG